MRVITIDIVIIIVGVVLLGWSILKAGNRDILQVDVSKMLVHFYSLNELIFGVPAVFCSLSHNCQCSFVYLYLGVRRVCRVSLLSKYLSYLLVLGILALQAAAFLINLFIFSS